MFSKLTYLFTPLRNTLCGVTRIKDTATFGNNLFVSKEAKKETMWNSIEPGDPYDIRKSMIARLPGAKSRFMGDNLDLVCLFQAA